MALRAKKLELACDTLTYIKNNGGKMWHQDVKNFIVAKGGYTNQHYLNYTPIFDFLESTGEIKYEMIGRRKYVKLAK